MKLFTSANIHKSTTITQNIGEHFSLGEKDSLRPSRSSKTARGGGPKPLTVKKGTLFKNPLYPSHSSIKYTPMQYEMYTAPLTLI